MNELLILDLDYEEEFIDRIHPVIVKDEHDMVLIDCAYPGSLAKLEAGVKEFGLSLTDLTKVMITHQDYDHMGALYELKSNYPHIDVYVSEFDRPYIVGEKPFLRLQMLQKNPKIKQTKGFQKTRKTYEKFGPLSHAAVDHTLKGGERFAWCGGITVIPTPGHLPGHLSIYLDAFQTLIPGDALIINKGKLDVSHVTFNLDHDQAICSVKELMKFPIKQIVCYHGGRYQGNIKDALQSILSQVTCEEDVK